MRQFLFSLIFSSVAVGCTAIGALTTFLRGDIALGFLNVVFLALNAHCVYQSYNVGIKIND
jgi:hypothetical protein